MTNKDQGHPFVIRPLHILLVMLAGLLLLHTGLIVHAGSVASRLEERRQLWDIAAAGLGLTDLCIATEARYTRHPAVSDPVSPFMDHPDSIEHFPTGSFWAPPDLSKGLAGQYHAQRSDQTP